MSTDTMIQLLAMFFGAAATYGAIRNDIKNIHKDIEDIKADTDKAHARIDDMLMGRGK